MEHFYIALDLTQKQFIKKNQPSDISYNCQYSITPNPYEALSLKEKEEFDDIIKDYLSQNGAGIITILEVVR